MLQFNVPGKLGIGLDGAGNRLADGCNLCDRKGQIPLDRIGASLDCLYTHSAIVTNLLHDASVYFDERIKLIDRGIRWLIRLCSRSAPLWCLSFTIRWGMTEVIAYVLFLIAVGQVASSNLQADTGQLAVLHIYDGAKIAHDVKPYFIE